MTGTKTPPLRQMTMVFQEPYLISSTVGKKYRVSVENKGNAEGRDMPESGEAWRMNSDSVRSLTGA